MSKIKVRVSAEGEVTLDVSGAIGNACDALTAALEHELGLTTQKTRKDAYYATIESGSTTTTDHTHADLDH